MNKNKELTYILGELWLNRKTILIITLLSALLSVVISLLLPNYYQASTTVYAASQDLAQPSPIGGLEKPMEYYGSDTDMDRLFSIARSEAVAQFVIDSFDLYRHYDIDPAASRAAHKIRERLKKLYRTIKTEYRALEINVEDQDPVVATNMANAIRERIELLAMDMIKSSQKQQIANFENNIAQKEAELTLINDSLVILKDKFGVIDLANQSEVLLSQKSSLQSKYNVALSKVRSLRDINGYRDSIAYLNALVAGYQKELNDIDESLKKYNQGYNIVSQIDKDRSQYAYQISIDRQRLNQYKAIYNSDFPTLHTIQPATVPVNKSRPKRSLYVIGATLFGFVMAVCSVLLLKSYRGLDWDRIKHHSKA